MLGEKLEFEGLTGVGKVQLELEPSQQIYTFIGANGVGKTKTLEAMFQVLFFSHRMMKDAKGVFEGKDIVFQRVELNYPQKYIINIDIKSPKFINDWYKNCFSPLAHDYPVIYLGAQARGLVKHALGNNVSKLGSLSQRRESYLGEVLQKMGNDFGSLNMETSIEGWFITLARSSNPYQKKEDNRDIEIKTVIKLLNQLDNRIDPEFLEISGDDRVSLMISGQKRELSQLSSGFTSILKLMQAIVSGYGYFTNETNIQKVKGIVLIDEIESHLHLTWQASIIPLLKNIFPNTTFYITTHSSIVLSQLKEGEAYKLYRDEDGIVRANKIIAPNKSALIDIMKDVFKVDLNQMKLDNSSVNEQKEAKNNLLNLLKQQEPKQ